MSEPDQHPAPWPSWASEPISVVDYDPAWLQQGTHECDQLQQLLASWLTDDVEHVGSTAVPGLAAKPIIDLQAPIHDLADAERLAPVLAPHGWHYVPPELDQRPHRRLFIKVVHDRRAAHLHLMTTASARWHQQLAFRDALRANPDLVRTYARLKHELAHRHEDDREAYTAGKQRFVDDVLAHTT